jgi:hypothetical protein
MSARVKKLHPALKHGGYCATGLLPGEDHTAFERLYQDLIADLRPDGPLENDIVASIARLYWRKQNLDTFRIAESARNRFQPLDQRKRPRRCVPLLSMIRLRCISTAWRPLILQGSKRARKRQKLKLGGSSERCINLSNCAQPRLLIKCGRSRFGCHDRQTPQATDLL